MYLIISTADPPWECAGPPCGMCGSTMGNSDTSDPRECGNPPWAFANIVRESPHFRVFCDFCKQLKAQSAKISASRHLSTHKSIDDDCKCSEMQPGLYDIETEMCTPEIDDVKDYIPPEIQANILDKRPVSLFVLFFL
ncbi:hypothetical protein Y032_0002g1007 [Ancylostoma ceylanicum]|uniref:Uncharacterized protein n=1 Tax=Ancylostoma ceylanicum TaxID=53326 RepID=A0A016W0W6_9BILA|nr:hypothetical protein Y032_0002g1007 [Ancylostoma ceylanicum]